MTVKGVMRLAKSLLNIPLTTFRHSRLPIPYRYHSSGLAAPDGFFARKLISGFSISEYLFAAAPHESFRTDLKGDKADTQRHRHFPIG